MYKVIKKTSDSHFSYCIDAADVKGECDLLRGLGYNVTIDHKRKRITIELK